MLRNTDLAEKTKKVVEGEEQSYNSQRDPAAIRQNGMLGQRHTKVRTI